MPRNQKVERDYELALLFQSANRYGTRYWFAQPIKITDRTLPSLGLRGFVRSMSYYGDEEELFFDGLEMFVMEYQSSEGPGVGGFYIEYRDHSIPLHQIPIMARFATKIARDMARETEENGVPADFGQYVYRIARSIGATRIVIPTTQEGRSYADNVYLPLMLSEGMAYINQTIEQWKQTERERIARSAA